MLPTTEAEIDAFLAAFEAGTLPKTRWTHGAHLLTGACYVHKLGEAAAIDKIRTCVRRYNEAVGGENTDTSGYHETVTVLWIKLLAKLLRESQPIGRAEFAQLARRAVCERPRSSAAVLRLRPGELSKGAEAVGATHGGVARMRGRSASL